MSPSSVDQELKASRSGSARIHGMRSITKASIAYVTTQVCNVAIAAAILMLITGSICADLGAGILLH
jgi:hypothetical protein